MALSFLIHLFRILTFSFEQINVLCSILPDAKAAITKIIWLNVSNQVFT